MTRRVEISGSIENGMWDYQPVYPAVRIESMPTLDWKVGEGQVFSESLTFGGQSASSVATGGHLFAGYPDIADIGLDRLIVDAVIVEVDVEPRGTITLAQVQSALQASEEAIRPGDALLIATGWDSKWNAPDFLTDSPGLSNELARWAVEQQVGILGSDIPLYDPNWRSGDVLPPLYRANVLVFAPLVNLRGHSAARAKLYALPLKVRGTCAAPSRSFLEFNDDQEK